MGRHRAFDDAEVLDAAIDCFWRRGYEATSVRDLAATMGIGSASLYNAFSDKRSLFARALERYLDRSMRERIARLERRLPPREAIRAFISEIIERSLGDKERRGCLLVNSALEIAPHDQALGAEIAGRLAELERFFRRSIVAAQADGSVPADRDADGIARLLLAVTLAIRVLARTDPRRALLEGAARPALDLLDPPARKRKGGKR